MPGMCRVLTSREARRCQPQGGFTLVELVVVIIILGVLAALAVPKFVALGTDARIASVKALAGTLQSTALNVRAICKINPACDYTLNYQLLTLGGRQADLNYGWLDSGDTLGGNEIDGWIDYSGFTASLPQTSYTLFSLDGAPDPATCSVSYADAYYRGPTLGILITTNTAGC